MADRVEAMRQRGLERAVQTVDGPVTDDDRTWLELGVTCGVLAALQCLQETGLLPCSD